MKYLYLIFSLLIFQTFFLIEGSAQDPKQFKNLFRDAEYSFQVEDYKSAIKTYKELLELDSTNSNLHFLIGYSYLMGRYNREIAIHHLEKAVINVSEKYREGVYYERNAPVLAHFLLGRAYHKNYQFTEAIESYKNYQEYLDFISFAEIEFVKRQIKSCDYAIEMIETSVPVNFYPLSDITNTRLPCRNPLFSGNDSVMIYAMDQSDGSSIAMITRSDTGWSEPRNLDMEINLSGYFYPVSLSYDAKELYLVYKAILVSNLYVSYYDGKRWSEPEALNEINTKYYETHASISSDGNSLYITSNRKGGWGGMDIYKSMRDENGNWGEPVNLGFGINTYYNEETPFFSENDSVLYFSSDGFETMGGYDIFFSRIDEDSEFTVPRNLGYPISTPDDDLFYNPGWDGTRSYFARQPENDLTTSIIYAVINSSEIDHNQEFLADAISEKTKEDVIIAENLLPENQFSDSVLADNMISALPENEINVEDSTETEIIVANNTISENLVNDSEIINADSDRVTEVNKTVVDTKLYDNHAVNDYYYILNNILFAYDDYTLNKQAIQEAERIYAMMQKYPGIEIELIGHTDSEGPSDYNLLLSKRRAQSLADYLVQKGIAARRIRIVGRGEEDPVAINKFKDGTDARIGRRLNRNVSIRINNKPGDVVRMAEIFVPPALVPDQDRVYTVLLLENKAFLDTIPNELFGQAVSLISTDESKMYVLGSYNKITEAHKYLYEAIDNGYPEATVMEKRKFESTVRKRTSGDQLEKLRYTIQILALKNPIDINDIKDIDSVRMERGEDNYYRYVYGDFTNINEAQRVLTRIKEIEAYSTAFIRPFAAGKASPVLRINENEATENKTAKLNVESKKEILCYSIQILATKNPINISMINELDSVRVIVGDDGYYKYIYGNFKSIDKAKTALNNIKKMEGYESAFIRAIRDEKIVKYDQTKEQVIKDTAEVQYSTGKNPDILGFTIQVLAVKDPVFLAKIDKLENVRVMIGKDGYHRYIYGSYKTKSDAEKDLVKIRETEEFKEAFVRSLSYYEQVSKQ